MLLGVDKTFAKRYNFSREEFTSLILEVIRNVFSVTGLPMSSRPFVLCACRGDTVGGSM